MPYVLIVAGLAITIGGGIAFALVGRDEGTISASTSADFSFSSSAIPDDDDVVVDQMPTPGPSLWRDDAKIDAGASTSPSLRPSGGPEVPLPSSFPTATVVPTPIPSNAPTIATEQPTDRKTYHTIIVGAGAAGLSAAYTLQNEGLRLPSEEIHILESASTLGGRVQKDTTFAPYPLDLGASFVQYDDAIEAIVGADRLDTPAGTGLPVFVNYTWWDFFDEFIAPKDKESVIEYACRVVLVAYANNDVDDENKVVTQCKDGRTFVSNHVIITVPLPILRDRVIDFRPPLPTSMTTDHPGLPQWEGFKVFLEVRRADFLRKNHIESIAPDGYLTEAGENLFWKQHGALDNGNEIIAGYLLGDQSNPYIDLDDESIIQEILALLDDQYNGKVSRLYVRGFVKNWSKDTNTKGTLSTFGYDQGGSGYPSGAQNIYNMDRVWTAGEAFPIDGSNGWVDSGAFSGDDAAKQIIELTEGPRVGPDDLLWTRVESRKILTGEKNS